MIVDLPDTTTNEINKKITELREQEGAITLGRVLTLVVVADSDDPATDAIDSSTRASREANRARLRASPPSWPKNWRKIGSSNSGFEARRSTREA